MRTYRKYNWPELIASFEQSGLSQTAFCEQHQINPKYFSQKRTAHLEKPENVFAKIEVNEAKKSSPVLDIQVGRCRIQCPDDMPLTDFVSLVHQLA